MLTAEEIGKLLGELADPWRTAIYVAVTTKLRVSELLALKWADMDFQRERFISAVESCVSTSAR